MKINTFDDYGNYADNSLQAITDLKFVPLELARIIYDYLGVRNKQAEITLLQDTWKKMQEIAEPNENIPFYVKRFLSAVSASITHIQENNTQPITLSLFQDEKDNFTKEYTSGKEALQDLFKNNVIYKVKYPTNVNTNHYYFRFDDFIDFLNKNYPEATPEILNEVIKPSLLLLCDYKEYCLTPLQAQFLTKQIKLEIIKEEGRGWDTERQKSFFAKKRELNLNDINEYLTTYDEPSIKWFSKEENGAANLLISQSNYTLKQILESIPSFISDWVNLETRRTSVDFLKDAPELKHIPLDLVKIIYEYLDIMITDQEIKQLVDVNQQLQALNIPRYTTFTTAPDVLDIYSEILHALEIKMPAKVSYDERNKFSDTTNYTCYYDPTKGLAELINGVMVGYGSDEKLRDRFAKSPQKMFSLLKFLKDFRIAQDVPPEGKILVQQLLTGILKLAQTHQSLELSAKDCKELAKNTGKVGVLTPNSSLQNIHQFEDYLNRYLKEQKCEPEAIDFVTVDIFNTVTIYVKSTAPHATRLLGSLYECLPDKLIHISPSAYLQLMVKGGTLTAFLKVIDSFKKAIGDTELDGRQQYLQQSLENLNLDSKALSEFKWHSYFGYKATVSHRLFTEIKSLEFTPGIQAVRDHVLKIVNEVKSYTDEVFIFSDSIKKRDTLLNLMKTHTDMSNVLFVPHLDKITELERGIKFLESWKTDLQPLLEVDQCIKESHKRAKKGIEDFKLTLTMLQTEKTEKFDLSL